MNTIIKEYASLDPMSVNRANILAKKISREIGTRNANGMSLQKVTTWNHIRLKG